MVKWLCTQFLGRSHSQTHDNACKVALATSGCCHATSAWRNPHKVWTSVLLTLDGSDFPVQPKQNLWKSFGNPLEIRWKTYGNPLEILRKFSEILWKPTQSLPKPALDPGWVIVVSFPNPLDFRSQGGDPVKVIPPCASSRNPMEILWKSYGNPIESLWKPTQSMLKLLLTLWVRLPCVSIGHLE